MTTRPLSHPSASSLLMTYTFTTEFRATAIAYTRRSDPRGVASQSEILLLSTCYTNTLAARALSRHDWSIRLCNIASTSPSRRPDDSAPARRCSSRGDPSAPSKVLPLVDCAHVHITTDEVREPPWS